MKELWKRVLLPVTIPLAALAVIAFTVLNISRVLIAVEESNSPGLTTLLACVLAGGVLGLCVYFASTEAERRKHNEGAFLSLGAVALLVCGLWGYQAVETRADAERLEAGGEEVGPADATVHAFDLGFDEKTLSVGPGEVVIEYVNKGTQAHTFVIEGVAGILEVGTKGDTDKGAFPLETPGEYVYFCDVAGHRQAGMEGKLTVAEGAGGGGGEGAGGGGATVEVGNTLTFAPAEITAAPGPLKITLKATTALAHTLVIEGAPEFKKLEVAKEGDAPSGTFDAKEGEYTFYCDIPGHRQAGMEGKIKIGAA